MRHAVKYSENVKLSALQGLVLGSEASGTVLVKLLLFDIFLCRTSVSGRGTCLWGLGKFRKNEDVSLTK